MTTTTAAEDRVFTVLPAGRRPRPAGRLSASITFAWRVFLRIRHVPEQLAAAAPPGCRASRLAGDAAHVHGVAGAQGMNASMRSTGRCVPRPVG
jgi:2-polyprenyl-6-methoxyphenol hydroxylase-like FAD-dependent oxidoreductase